MGSVFCQEYVSPRRFISTRAPAGPSGSVSGRRNPPKGPFRLGKHEVQKKNTDETRVFWGAEPKALPRAENQKGGRRSSCVHHAHGLGRADGLGRRVHHDRSDRRAARRCRCKCRQQRPGCCHQQIRERRSAHASAPPYRTAAFTATAATSTTVAVVTAATASAVSANSSADEDLTADQDGTYDVAMQDVARKLRATGLTPAEALAAASLASRPCKSAQPCDVCSAKRGQVIFTGLLRHNLPDSPYIDDECLSGYGMCQFVDFLPPKFKKKLYTTRFHRSIFPKQGAENRQIDIMIGPSNGGSIIPLTPSTTLYVQDTHNPVSLITHTHHTVPPVPHTDLCKYT